MDPNETLKTIRALIDDINSKDAIIRPSEARNVLIELAESFEALDDWMTRGGFAPDAWTEVARREELMREEMKERLGITDPPTCTRCGENEARYLSGQCGVCDSLLLAPTKRIADADIDEVIHWGMLVGKGLYHARGGADD